MTSPTLAENFTEIPAESSVYILYRGPKNKDYLWRDMKTYSVDATFELYTAF